MTTNHTIENASLGAGITTGLMGVITQNATAISVLATIGFGVIYASCAIFREYQTYKRDRVSKVSQKDLIAGLIDELVSDGKSIELIKILSDKKAKL
jgi:hypothetical protein